MQVLEHGACGNARRVVVHALGGPEQLNVEPFTDVPPPKASELLVDVEAAGVNYLDIMQRKGLVSLPLPYMPGLEGMGRVRELGEGVTSDTRFRVGARVAWINVCGSYASTIAIPASQAIPIPATFTTEQSLLFQALTAQYLATEYRDIKPGERVLVHAAAGGVGQILVQWLKHRGAWVVGTASNEAKGEIARAAGADAVINYGRDYRFYDDLMVITGGRGVDLAFDSVGAATFPSSQKSLARGGTVVSCGSSSGPPPAINPSDLIYPCTRVAGGAVFRYVQEPSELQRRAAEAIAGIDAGWIRMPKGTAYDLAGAADAHRDLEGRAARGKLYLRP